MNKKRAIALSFLSCRDVMPDPHFYRQCLVDAYSELRMAALPEAAAPSEPARRKVVGKPKPKPKAKQSSKTRKHAKVSAAGANGAKVEPEG